MAPGPESSEEATTGQRLILQFCHYFSQFSSQCSNVRFRKYCGYTCGKNICILVFLGSPPCYNDVEMLTDCSWNDSNIRKVFIRKVNFHVTLVTALPPQLLWS